MNKTLLINRLNPQDFTMKKKVIFFLIGDMNIPSNESKLIEVLNNSNFVKKNEVLYKYNGVELILDVQTIPKVVKLLSSEDFLIYSIYEVYNPDL